MENKKNCSLVYSTGKRKRIKAEYTNVYYTDGVCLIMKGQKEEFYFAMDSRVRGISYSYKGREYGLRVINHELRLGSTAGSLAN